MQKEKINHNKVKLLHRQEHTILQRNVDLAKIISALKKGSLRSDWAENTVGGNDNARGQNHEENPERILCLGRKKNHR